MIDQHSSLVHFVKHLNDGNGNGKPGTSILGKTWLGRLYHSIFEYEKALDINAAIQNGQFDTTISQRRRDKKEQVKK